jgi:hypothetical protein
MRCAPSASAMVTTADNPSGTTATAILTDRRVFVPPARPEEEPVPSATSPGK